MKILYSIKDTVTGLWTEPAAMNNDREAKRAFKMLTEDKNTMIGAHPEDYQLHKIAEWDPEHGSIKNVCKNLLMSGHKPAEE